MAGYPRSPAISGYPLSGRTRKTKTKVISLTIGTWNVRTLLYSSDSDRRQRRTALVGRELDRYKVEIAALSETVFSEEGLLKEDVASYTFFWSGCKKEERRGAGVGFAIRRHLVSKPDDAEPFLI